MNVKEILAFHAERLEREFEKLWCGTGLPMETVMQASAYSLLDGGKRLRPVLLLEFYRLFGGEGDLAMPFACALEMIHTYSLIHDDLPAMDNDDMRRGKPSCHIRWGEGMAILAGDALLNRSFEVMLGAKGIPAERIIAAASEMGARSGIFGMIGGQTMDIGGDYLTPERMELMISLKTGALFEAACVCGAILAGADENGISAARSYARALGIAFQIADDILDMDTDPKSSISLYGEKRCAEMVEEYTAAAIAAVENIPGSEFQKELAKYLVGRKS